MRTSNSVPRRRQAKSELMAFGSWHGRGDWHSRLRWVVGHLYQGVHVEDEADPAIAENRAAGQQVLLPESVAENS